MNKQLTEKEQNVIKDILKIIGKDDEMNESFAAGLGMDVEEFDEITETIFRKCENGRLTVQT